MADLTLLQSDLNPSSFHLQAKRKNITLINKQEKWCYEFYQNSNRMNCHQIEGNKKIIAQRIKENINNTANTKVGTDGQT